jgi:hypothetical protein
MIAIVNDLDDKFENASIAEKCNINAKNVALRIILNSITMVCRRFFGRMDTETDFLVFVIEVGFPDDRLVIREASWKF